MNENGLVWVVGLGVLVGWADTAGGCGAPKRPPCVAEASDGVEEEDNMMRRDEKKAMN